MEDDRGVLALTSEVRIVTKETCGALDQLETGNACFGFVNAGVSPVFTLGHSGSPFQ